MVRPLIVYKNLTPENTLPRHPAIGSYASPRHTVARPVGPDATFMRPLKKKKKGAMAESIAPASDWERLPLVAAGANAPTAAAAAHETEG